MKTPFVYLVQGEANLVEPYMELGAQEHSDAIFLTYDEPLDGAIFYPHSTWAQGRNRLLEVALKNKEYLYYIFCDDDIEFIKGSWQEFEYNLLKYKPAIGVPVFPRTRPNILKYPKLNCQPFFINDEQLMAFHLDVVSDQLVLPYQTQFDKINWWASCEIQQILIQNFYSSAAMQFNTIQVENACTERYDSQHDTDKSFREFVNQWLESHFKGRYNLTSYYKPPRLHHILSRAVIFLTTTFLGKKNYSMHPKTLSKILIPDSDLLKQAHYGKPKQI